MNIVKQYSPGILICLIIAGFSWVLGSMLPVIGGPVFAILIGMLAGLITRKYDILNKGIGFASKNVLQYAVVLLGFGMNFLVVLETGKQSLPIIISTITVALLVAFFLYKVMHVPENVATLVGVGSSICGGSAIAATAPIVNADNEEIAQSISVIFFFNVLAALLFPTLGGLLGFDTTTGEAFGIFAGTAINDTSSVTAASSTWDSLYNLGSNTLDTAVTVKLTRTLAIIPITLVLAFYQSQKTKKISVGDDTHKKVNIKKVFPIFILGFIIASLITTFTVNAGVSIEVYSPLKALSKFFIIMAMAGIGLNTNIIKLIKTGGKPLLMGFCCWVSITLTSLGVQYIMGIW